MAWMARTSRPNIQHRTILTTYALHKSHLATAWDALSDLLFLLKSRVFSYFLCHSTVAFPLSRSCFLGHSRVVSSGVFPGNSLWIPPNVAGLPCPFPIHSLLEWSSLYQTFAIDLITLWWHSLSPIPLYYYPPSSPPLSCITIRGRPVAYRHLPLIFLVISSSVFFFCITIRFVFSIFLFFPSYFCFALCKVDSPVGQVPVWEWNARGGNVSVVGGWDGGWIFHIESNSMVTSIPLPFWIFCALFSFVVRLMVEYDVFCFCDWLYRIRSI